MHHIYHTEAYVLAGRAKGEDSKVIVLFTKELGLVHAHAQGVRKLSSKLRYTLQDFSRVNIDLVRGKEVWRVTTAIPTNNGNHVLISADSKKIMARVSSLLIRLITGEEKNEEIFGILSRMYFLLENPKEKDLRVIELLTVARILVALGYLSRDSHGIYSEDGNEDSISNKLSDLTYQHKLILEINQALSLSHL